jgi:hypothetical protein
MIRLIRVGSRVWTVVRQDGEVTDLDEWPQTRARYYAMEWFEWLGCEDALGGAYAF